MNCDDVRAALSDRLDDLLDASASRAVDEHLAACEACAARAERARRLRDALRRPWSVAPAPADMVERIRGVAFRRPAPRVVGVLVRHGLAFAAGVLATLALVGSPEEPRPAAPTAATPAVEVSHSPPPPPRRIR
jgi:anti-sigma factor RsiW